MLLLLSSQALKNENTRLQAKVLKMEKALEEVELAKKKVEKDLTDAMEKTEQYFVTSNRINEAMNGTGASGGDFQVPDKVKLTEVSETEVSHKVSPLPISTAFLKSSIPRPMHAIRYARHRSLSSWSTGF